MAAASSVRMTGALRRAHLGRGLRGGGRTRLTRTSRGSPLPSPHPSPAPGRAREFGGHIATPTIVEGVFSELRLTHVLRSSPPEIATRTGDATALGLVGTREESQDALVHQL